MQSNFLCLLALIAPSSLFSCQPQEQAHNVYLDPAHVMLDKAGNVCCNKKVDGQNQFERNKKRPERRRQFFGHQKKVEKNAARLAAERIIIEFLSNYPDYYESSDNS